MSSFDNKPDLSQSLTFDPRPIHFNSGIAQDFGMEISLWLDHLAFWAHKNLLNKRHLHDGLVWCYDTLDALCGYFPFFSKRQIERIINQSVEAGLVQKGNYNETKYDRTCWYALTPKAYFYFPHLLNPKFLEALFHTISPNGEMDFREWGNGFPQTVIPIPYTDPYTDPDNKSSISPFSKTQKQKPRKYVLDDMLKENPHNLEENKILDWIESRKSKRAAVTETAWKRVNENLTKLNEAGLNPHDCFEKAVASGWAGIEVRYFEDEMKHAEKVKAEEEKQMIRQREREWEEKKREEIGSAERVSTDLRKPVNVKQLLNQQRKEMQEKGINHLDYHEKLTGRKFKRPLHH